MFQTTNQSSIRDLVNTRSCAGGEWWRWEGSVAKPIALAGCAVKHFLEGNVPGDSPILVTHERINAHGDSEI